MSNTITNIIFDRTLGDFIKIFASPPHNEFTKAITDKFDDIDKNKDGFLDLVEIDKALSDPIYTGLYGAMVATIKKHLEDFEELSDDEWGDENDGITRADITAYDLLRLKDPKNEVINNMEWLYNYAKKKIGGKSKNLFVNGLDFYSVEQGQIGDCWYLAAIVGVVAMGRNREIRDMIKPKGRGSYEIKFPGISERIAITEPTDGEIGLLSTTNQNGLWITVLEKAYGTLKIRDDEETSVIDPLDKSPLCHGIEIITGNSVDTDWLSFTSISTLRKKLEKALENNKVVTASIRGEGGEYRENGLPMGHAYTVLSYVRNMDKIKIRNPWGHGGIKFKWPIYKGSFIMDLEKFCEDFSFIAFEE